MGSCIRPELVFVLVSAFRWSLGLIATRHVHLVSPCTALRIRPVRKLPIRPVGGHVQRHKNWLELLMCHILVIVIPLLLQSYRSCNTLTRSHGLRFLRSRVVNRNRYVARWISTKWNAIKAVMGIVYFS